MDCGPAALRSLLAGFGVPISYGGLREACRTDVDGTSINALETAAAGLGLDCVQVMVPADHVLPASLPALLVVGLPSGMPHFVIGWRAHGRHIQVMDPAAGRLLVRRRSLESRLYRHEQPVPAAAFAAYAEGPAFRAGLRRRLAALGIRSPEADRRIADARAAGWRAVATLDAAVRQRGGARRRPAEAVRLLDSVLETPETIADESWFARPSEDEQVVLRGAVQLQARGLAADPPDPDTLPRDLQAALRAGPARPARRLLDETGVARAAWLGLGALVLLAGGLSVLLTATLRGAIDQARPGPALAAALGLTAVLAFVELGLAGRLLTLGRRLEGGLRRGLRERIPLLPDRYLRSRPSSDLAGRAHQLHELRNLPLLLGQAGVAAVELVVLAVALIVTHPPAAPLVLAAAALVGLTAVAVQPPLREREQRHVEHSAALAQLELDGVLAVHPIRSLGGIDALGAEHTERLGHWRGAALAAGRARTAAAVVQNGLGAILAVLIVTVTLPDLNRPATALLVVLWALGIPLAGERLTLLAQHWPGLRTLALRLAEPLEAPVEEGAGRRAEAGVAGPAAIHLRRLSVVAGGRPVLTDVDLDVAPGEHLAVVGASGSGKSTLMAVLLGLLEPTAGTVCIDGVLLDRAAAERLWPGVAWVDPQVRVWNAPMADNVGAGDPQAVRRALSAAELDTVQVRVGDQPLGDDGGLLSGGEAQRVRLARALAQDGVRLVVLDEALRGLDRGQRGRLLATARRHWPARPCSAPPTTSPTRPASDGCWSSTGAASSRTAIRPTWPPPTPSSRRCWPPNVGCAKTWTTAPAGVGCESRQARSASNRRRERGRRHPPRLTSAPPPRSSDPPTRPRARRVPPQRAPGRVRSRSGPRPVGSRRTR